jgi:hypothetical protein
MRTTRRIHYPKAFYRPVEAAIRWSNLTRFESRILAAVKNGPLPDRNDFPRWPLLRLNTERIFDAVRNGDLPYGKAGITRQDPSLFDDPELTVRHVDLKTWMSRFYPGERPSFLFDELEQQLHPALRLESVQVLLADREALKIQLAAREQSFDTLRAEHESLRQKVEQWTTSGRTTTQRSEGTYLNIVGGLLTLLLGQSPSGKPYSSFGSVESVINALLAHHEGVHGISQRTLQAKFAQAKRNLQTR